MNLEKHERTILNAGLYYGKENLMNDKLTENEKVIREMNMEKGSRFLGTIHNEELLAKAKELMELYGWDMNNASQCEKALREAKTMLKIKAKKVKPKRFHLELSSEQGQAFTELAERMNITLSTLVKLLLMDKYLSLKSGKYPMLVIDFDG